MIPTLPAGRKKQHMTNKPGSHPSDVTDYLDEVIIVAKRNGKTLEECIRNFYAYNKYFNKEQEDYIRAHW